MDRRTKIVCTIGPASDSPECLENLIRAGMNVARLNFSHGSHEEHLARYNKIRTAALSLDKNLAIMMDLQGPKIRTGHLEGTTFVELVEGDDFVISTENCPGDAFRVSTTYKNLANDVHPGDRILISDGSLEVQVRTIEPPDIHCVVIRGGTLGAHKGINLPGVDITEASLTEKDLSDIDFGLKLGVDYIALSFVRRPDDIRCLRKIIDESGAETGIIAKIERPEALECFEEIVTLSDAVMVARGDLGVEVDFEEVPVIQKRLIHQCNEMGVPVITATQMLESMINHPRPTRAEVADVSSAILDGTDAVMLSGETAAGRYPVETCAVMARIAFKTDNSLATIPQEERRAQRQIVEEKLRVRRERRSQVRIDSFADAMGLAVCRLAEMLDIKRIICFTKTGYTALAMARHRPASRITAITNSESTLRKCALMWGINALKTDDFDRVDELSIRVEKLLLEHNLVLQGETVIIVAGSPMTVGGRTNLMELHTIGEML